MSRLAHDLIVRLNARRPLPFSAGPRPAHAYAQWEWTEGAKVFRKCYAGHLALEGQKILDLACGLGGKTCWLATHHPASVTGLDLDAPHLEAAAAFLAHHRETGGIPAEVPVEFVLADASQLPFGDRTFDIVITSDSMEHFADAGAVLTEIWRVLKPGGKLLIDFAPWAAKYGPHMHRWIATPWVHHWLSDPEIISACEAIAASWKAQTDSRDIHAQIAEKLADDIAHFHQHLNRITLRDFFTLLDGSGPWKTRHKQYTGAALWAWPLAQLGWDTYIGRLALILEKPE